MLNGQMRSALLDVDVRDAFRRGSRAWGAVVPFWKERDREDEKSGSILERRDGENVFRFRAFERDPFRG